MPEDGEGAACGGRGLPQGVKRAICVWEHDSAKGSAATGGLKSFAALGGAGPTRAHDAGPCLSLRLLVEEQQHHNFLDGLEREEREDWVQPDVPSAAEEEEEEEKQEKEAEEEEEEFFIAGEADGDAHDEGGDGGLPSRHG